MTEPTITDPEEGPLYRFKWSNWDLDRHIEDRKFAATQLRRQASDLSLRAEQIEEECAKLKTVLFEVKDAERRRA